MSRNHYDWIDRESKRNNLHLLPVEKNGTIRKPFILFNSASWNWSDLDLNSVPQDERQRHEPDIVSSYRMDSEEHIGVLDLKYDRKAEASFCRVQCFRPVHHASNKHVWSTEWILERCRPPYILNGERTLTEMAPSYWV